MKIQNSKSLIVLSLDPLARTFSFLKTKLVTENEWSLKVPKQVPVVMSQSLIVPSLDPLVRLLLLLKATLRTSSE